MEFYRAYETRAEAEQEARALRPYGYVTLVLSEHDRFVLLYAPKPAVNR